LKLRFHMSNLKPADLTDFSAEINQLNLSIQGNTVNVLTA
jgi:hypothetical protein